MRSFRFFAFVLSAIFSTQSTTLSNDVLPPTKNTEILLTTQEQTIVVRFFSPTIVHIQKWLTVTNPEEGSFIVIAEPLNPLNLQRTETANDIVLASSEIMVRIQKATGIITFLRNNGHVLLAENGAAYIEPAPLPTDSLAHHVQQRFTLSASEALYGLGQHQDGYMNYRGKKVVLVQTNTDAVTPFLISTAGYGILWDNYSKTIFSDEANETYFWSDVGNSVNYYFLSGATMDSVIAGYRWLTGQPPLYGKWAYGYWQSKEHYDNREELLSVAAEYRKRRIPIDNIIQDWDYWDGAPNWGQLFFDEKKFPNPQEMLDILHRQHYHVMISIWPGLGPNTPVYKEMEKYGCLYKPVGWAGFKYFDAYNPKANEIFWKHAKKGLFDLGIDAWWFDSTEPDVINALTKESSEYELKRMENHYRGSFARYLNPYSLFITEALYKNLRATTDKQRVYILTRSTFAGQQRAAATTWSGDIGASWEIYKRQIPAGLNHSMAGIPYWTFDIGAFVIGSYEGVFSRGGKDPAYQELYTRMFQFGTFCPIFRSHGSETPREVWEFGEFTPVLVKFLNLRYRLLPYIYSLAHQVTAHGYTILRGLAMDFPNDTRTYSIDDQFMFGPALMACPVTEYMLYRPPEQSIPVSSQHFITANGQRGLLARYYKDTQYKELSLERIDSTISVYWYTGRPEYVTDSTLSIRWEGKLVPSQTGKHQFHLKCFGPKRIYLNSKQLSYVYQSVEVYTEPVELEAGKPYDFVLESENYNPGALRVLLYWKTPEIFARESLSEKHSQTRTVYLPAGTKWYDFWTGKQYKGDTTLVADAPVERIPLYVRAGSLLPLGPFLQYATEKPADTLEIRIYPGADGTFTLYEDENDNYNYEKGMYATIPFEWNDTKRQLRIGNRHGSFPGMLQNRIFTVVLVEQGKGTDINLTSSPDHIVSYNGTEVVLQF